MGKEYITNLINIIKFDMDKTKTNLKTLHNINNIHTLNLNKIDDSLNKLINGRVILESLQFIDPLNKFEKLNDLLRNNSTQIHIHNKTVKNAEDRKIIIDFLIQVQTEKKELLSKLLDKLIILKNNN